MGTPHISARAGDFAELCLFPGDPLRAKYIAEYFFTHPREVNTTRNMLAFTGSYRGQTVSVMGSGMGIPSCTLYATELIRDFGVRKLVRVGTCGAVAAQVQLRDIIIAQAASTDSAFNRNRFGGFDLAAISDFGLLQQVVAAAEKSAQPVHVGNVFSTDRFYSEPELTVLLQRFGILGIEMEAAGLFSVAAEYGAKALAVLSVSDHLLQDTHLDAVTRQTGFTDMIELTLNGLVT
ncbi:purine-nucleoside phosphorylase [Pseudidiomarina sp.]|uniref:purine-nucleoside phosphorylase n=1 Tax=Pseudidiomarina sp. TaxID=2081707 RepID=UPI00299EF4A7|nr:purine-nucleoside phosphorylase [Pseudidiomarina sp.]MDX1706237.1 purine-nucleoside phosphorylase [Pseudidiomarina sp.]